MEGQQNPTSLEEIERLTQIQTLKDNYINWQHIRLDDPSFESARKKYLEENIEKPYQEFLAKYGQVKCQNLKEFLDQQLNYGKYLKEEGVNLHEKRSHYDFGYRFLIDILSNENMEITSEEALYMKNFLMGIAPYYFKEQIYFRDRQLDDFFKNYPAPGKIAESIICMYKKCKKEYYIQSPYDIWTSVRNTFIPEDVEKLKAWQNVLPPEYLNYVGKLKELQPYILDSLRNCALPQVALSKLLRELEKMGKIKDPKNYEDKEITKELFIKAENEFGGSFHPEMIPEE